LTTGAVTVMNNALVFGLNVLVEALCMYPPSVLPADAPETPMVSGPPTGSVKLTFVGVPLTVPVVQRPPSVTSPELKFSVNVVAARTTDAELNARPAAPINTNATLRRIVSPLQEMEKLFPARFASAFRCASSATG